MSVETTPEEANTAEASPEETHPIEANAAEANAAEANAAEANAALHSAALAARKLALHHSLEEARRWIVPAVERWRSAHPGDRRAPEIARALRDLQEACEPEALDRLIRLCTRTSTRAKLTKLGLFLVLAAWLLLSFFGPTHQTSTLVTAAEGEDGALPAAPEWTDDQALSSAPIEAPITLTLRRADGAAFDALLFLADAESEGARITLLDAELEPLQIAAEDRPSYHVLTLPEATTQARIQIHPEGDFALSDLRVR